MAKEENKIIDLKYSIPVKQEGGSEVQIHQLSLGRFKAKHFKLLPDNFNDENDKITPAAIIPLIAGLANISMESADEIDIVDLMTIAEGLESFLSVSLGTGKK